MENEFINWRLSNYRKKPDQLQNSTTAGEDKKLKKNIYNKAYYAQSSNAKKILKNLELLTYYGQYYGDNMLIDAQILNDTGFDWKVVTGLIQHEGFEYKCMGSLAYAVFDNHKIKIISI